MHKIYSAAIAVFISVSHLLMAAPADAGPATPPVIEGPQATPAVIPPPSPCVRCGTPAVAAPPSLIPSPIPPTPPPPPPPPPKPKPATPMPTARPATPLPNTGPALNAGLSALIGIPALVFAGRAYIRSRTRK